MLGALISHYKIVGKVGEGGMGVVYKAEDTTLGREVALKFLPTGALSDQDNKARFLREARAAAGLQHPNICTIHEIAEADSLPFIVMAYLEGQDLARRLKLGPVPPEEALPIASQVAQGLRAAHLKGVLHRDVKPANIFLTVQGEAVVLDFGLAHLPGSELLTRSDAISGTTAYMSPEQANGEPLDQRTDVWSLGVVLYEMLTGHRPFEGEYPQAVAYAIVNEPVPPLAGAAGRLSQELDGILARALAKKETNATRPWTN